MNCTKYLLLPALFVAAAGGALAAEDLMPMVAGPYAYADRDPEPPGRGAGLDIGPLIGRQPKDDPAPAAKPALHKNVIRLTLPASQSAAALSEELAPFMYEEETAAPAKTVAKATIPSPAATQVGAVSTASPAASALPAIPGLMTPETLASLPSRDFRKDLKDLVAFDGQPSAHGFERFESAAYTMPISSPTYVAPAPEEFIPEPPPVASLSLPRPSEVMVPPPIAEAMPPLPYLDPLSQPGPAGPGVVQKDFGSKTQALIRLPSNASRVPVRPPAEPAGSMPLRPPADFTAGSSPVQSDELPTRLFPTTGPMQRSSSPAREETAAGKGEMPDLSGPLLSIRSSDDAPRAKKRFVDKPEVISGVPALAPTQFKTKAKTSEVAAGSVQAEKKDKAENEESAGFAPLRSLRSLLWGKDK
ncbi:MAG: hypothetical protein LUE17_16775 [Planctomycetaceae bacterium]|nr:hypothetical protein [Planctomycetaceae bacterium]